MTKTHAVCHKKRQIIAEKRRNQCWTGPSRCHTCCLHHSLDRRIFWSYYHSAYIVSQTMHLLIHMYHLLHPNLITT